MINLSACIYSALSPNDLRQAVVDVLPLWANPIFDDPSQINKRGYQSLFVLSLCRMLYTLSYGEIVSKPFAAKWAKENWSHWTELVECARVGRQNPGLEAQLEDIYGILELIRHTLEYSKQIENQANENQGFSSSSR